MKCESSPSVPSPVVLPPQTRGKRSRSPVPFDIRNGEPAEKASRREPHAARALEAEIQAIEVLQDQGHCEVPFEALWRAASLCSTLVRLLDPTGHALLLDLQSGKQLGPEQRDAFSAGLKDAMYRSGLFERVMPA